MTTDEAWEKFKLSDSDRIGKSSTAAMLETILAQQNAINAKVDQILDENKGVPAEDMEEESADIPPAPPMDAGAPSPDIGSAPMAGAEGAMPEDAGMNAAETMPPIDESALLGGMPQDFNGNVPETAPNMGGDVPSADASLEDFDDDDGGSLEALLSGGQGMGNDSTPIDYSQFASQGQDYDDNISAITDAITGADDVDVQLGMTQVLQDYLSKKKGEGDMSVPDMPTPEEGNPLEAIVDAIASEGTDMGEVPVPEDGAGVEELADALAGGAPDLDEMPVGDVLSAEGDEGTADILDAIAGEIPEGVSDVPVDAGVSEDISADEEEEPVKKSFGDKDKECDDDEKESEDDDKKESKDDDDKDDKKESKKKYPWDEYLDEEESDSKDDDSKDDESDDDKKKESKEEDVPEDEADTVIAIDEEPISDVDTAAIEKVVGKKMSDLIMALREILGDDADTDINPMIAHGAVDLGPNTDPFMACGDSPEAMDKLTRSIDSLIEDRMRGYRGNDGKMYKVIKSEAQLRDEKTDKLKRSLSSNAVYHMTGREVLDAMKGLEENGVESIRKSFVNPYDIIVRSLDCAVGQEVTDKYLEVEVPTSRFRKANAFKSKVNELDYPDIAGAFTGVDDESKRNAILLNMYLDRVTKLMNLKKHRTFYKGEAGTNRPADIRDRVYKVQTELSKKGFSLPSNDVMGYPLRAAEMLLESLPEEYRFKDSHDSQRAIRDAYNRGFWREYEENLNDLIGIHDMLSKRGFQMNDIPMFAKIWQSIGNTVPHRDKEKFWRGVLDSPYMANLLKEYYGSDFSDADTKYDLYDLLERNYFRMPRTVEQFSKKDDDSGRTIYKKYIEKPDLMLALENPFKAPNMHTKKLIEALKANADLSSMEGSVPLPYFLIQIIDSIMTGGNRGMTDIFKEGGYKGRSEAEMNALIDEFNPTQNNVNNFNGFVNALNADDTTNITDVAPRDSASRSRLKLFKPGNEEPQSQSSVDNISPVEGVKDNSEDNVTGSEKKVDESVGAINEGSEEDSKMPEKEPEIAPKKTMSLAERLSKRKEK